MRRADGGVFGHRREAQALSSADVDADMWPIVERVNACGWAWTTESCQGHPPRLPVMLGVGSDDIGRVLQALAEASRSVCAGALDGRHDPGGCVMQIAFWCQPARGRYQVRLTAPWSAGHEAQRQVALQVLTAMSHGLT